MNLTDTQRGIHAFIAERIEADGFAPSQAEIARAFGFKGVRAAQYHLEALEAAGILERSPGRARSLRLLQMPDGPQQLALPANRVALSVGVVIMFLTVFSGMGFLPSSENTNLSGSG